MCTSVAQDEMATVLACYSDLPTDGMYASFNGSGAAHFAGVGLRGGDLRLCSLGALLSRTGAERAEKGSRCLGAPAASG